MQRHEVGAETGQSADALAYRIGNIMDLQIEENMFPLVLQIPYCVGTGTVKQFHADFIKRNTVAKGFYELLHILQ